MKTFGRIIGWLVVVIFLTIFYIFGALGYIPGLSKVLGAEKPRDLGITYTEADFATARAKSQLQYIELPSTNPPELSIIRAGTRPITTSWNSAEMTSLLNDRPWKYWPISDVQLRINDDGSVELSGVVDRDILKGYAAAIGVSPEVATGVISFLPPKSAFYIKATTSLKDNKVNNFEIQSVSYGKMIIPVSILLSQNKNNMINIATAADAISELSKYNGKRAAIINFINERLSKITGFYAKNASFNQGKLNFDGNLSETEATAR